MDRVNVTQFQIRGTQDKLEGSAWIAARVVQGESNVLNRDVCVMIPATSSSQGTVSMDPQKVDQWPVPFRYYPHGIAQCPPVDLLNPSNLHQNLADPEPFALDTSDPGLTTSTPDTMAIAMGWQKPDNVAGSSAPAIMVGLFVASGGLLFGYDTGAINGILAMTEFKEQFGKHTNCHDEKGAIDICTKDSSIIVAILSAGTALGALLAAPTGDSLGRRKTLLVAVGIFCLGAIFQVCANNIDLLLVGRFFAGIGVGLISVLVPLYQSEMAPKWIRGTLVCAYQLSITIGLLSASVVNILASKLRDSSAYRIPLGLQIVPAIILTGGLLLLPETPRFLVKKGLHTEAGLSLSRLRRLDITHPALVDELQEMIANHQYELTLGPDSYKDIFIGSPHLGRRTFTGCGLQMLQQLTGINFIMYYSTSFFDGAGVESPYTKSLIINVINVVSTIPGLVVIERWGRRKLLMIGAIGMAGCQLLMASFDTATGQSYEKASQTILITFCAINIFFFAASWGPVVWVVTSEIYPLKVRAKAMSVSTASNWLLNFGIGYSVPFLVGSGPGNASFGPKIFFIWGAFCILAVFFVWCNVYETSKISLEQIDEMYERVNHAWNSKSFEPSWSFQQMLNDGWSPSAHPPAGHELQTTTTASSTDTTLGDGDASSITVNQNNNNNGSSPSNNNNDQNKGPPPMAMANVDFSY
ncbi:RCO3 glucose transporter [Fusarium sp. NRRL 52700]|nr:RCO3 glucose transporter [Fusarium sp. NRRL 52700]